MSDGWEVTYSLDPKYCLDGLTDLDGDALKNIDEYLYGGNPRDSDTDNDGLNDRLEAFTYGTSLTKSDTDNDGWSDYYEVYTSGTNPTKADTDNNGIADRTEYYWWINTYGQSSTSAKSKIKIHDVDGDGLTDFAEINTYFTNPTRSDSDNDGLIDGDEILTYLTDPLEIDTDSDGFSDFEEVLNDTDPNDPNDYPIIPPVTVTLPPETITLPPETATVTESSGIVLISVLGISFTAFFALVVLFRKKAT